MTTPTRTASPSKRSIGKPQRESPDCPLRATERSYHSRMSIDLRDLVGYAAAILTTVAFVPQALKSWRTRDLSGVSLTMYGLFTAGVALWLAYGIMLGAWPIIVANTITLALAGMVLALKMMHR